MALRGWGIAVAAALIAMFMPSAAAQPSGALLDRLGACSPAIPPAVLASDRTWSPQDSRAADHAALRARLLAPMPEGAYRLLLFSVAAHHTRSDLSAVATRDSAGRWSVDVVQEHSSGLVQIPATQSRKTTSLSEEAGQALDEMLADECLALEPGRALSLTPPPAGALFWTLEIQLPHLQRTFSGVSQGYGVHGAVAQAILSNLP